MSTVQPMSDEEKLQWSGDEFHRKQYADYLTTFLMRKTLKEGSQEARSFCLAIDADWGEGKTFFVTNWMQDLKKSAEHPCFRFDAWTADINTDPLIAFMAALRNSLEEYKDAEGLEPASVKRIEAALINGAKKLRKALLPAGKTILRGIADRYTSGAISEVVRAYQEERLDELTFVEVSKGATSKLGDSLDICFDGILKEETHRGELVSQFKTFMQEAIEVICEGGNLSPPLFIFVDEVDRCRPTFSIELLEGLKHIFNVPGVSFVVSTNIEQLSQSVCAVYGSGFDGRSYLRRFFDGVYSLPVASSSSYIDSIVQGMPSITSKNVNSGIPKQGFVGRGNVRPVTECIAWVTDTFDVDLRSQRQLVELIDSAASGMPPGRTIHLIWLAVLCASFIFKRRLFDVLASNPIENNWESVWRESLLSQSFRLVSRDGSESSKNLFEVAQSYVGLSRQRVWDFEHRNRLFNINEFDYPQSIAIAFYPEVREASRNGLEPSLSIISYGHYVRCAGFFAESDAFEKR